MAAKKNTEGMAFIIESLKKNKSASYADIKSAADKKGLKVWPIMFGRAQLLLGHVTGAKRGTGKYAQAKAAKAKAAKAKAAKAGKSLPATPAKRAPGRPGKNAASSNGVNLDSIFAAVKASEADLACYRGALERIGALLNAVLTG
jgi:hypothetical protein